MKSITLRFRCPSCGQQEVILLDYKGTTFTEEERKALTEYFKLLAGKRCDK